MAAYGRVPLSVGASVAFRTADGPTDGEAGAVGRTSVGSARPAGVDGVAGVAVGVLSVGRVLAGACDADGVGTGEGLVAGGGGARGIVGDSGVMSVDKRSGSATRAATAHAAPTPTAVRRSRRRVAARRIAS